MLVTNDFHYKDEDTVCHGFLAYDDTLQKPLPCVMVAHDWRGRGDAACEKAKELAKMGYVGFALDMFGEGIIGKDNERRRALITPFLDNRKKLAKRVTAAFNALKAFPFIDQNNIAIMGYCFGGLCALDLARTGAKLKGAISFHGLLFAPADSKNTSFPAKVLVLHGYDDPMVPPEQVNQFAIEMTARGVDWQIHVYGHTTHSFTNKEANEPELGLRYNKTADQRSWQSTSDFLRAIFS